MENNQSSAEELKAIRQIMEESTKFLSLSGLSGIFPGIFAVAGAFIAWLTILGKGKISYYEYISDLSGTESGGVHWQMLIIALIVLFLSLISAFYFSLRKAKRSGKSYRTPVSKRLLINLFIPLLAGGIFALILMTRNYFPLIIPVFLIFYGLALISAGKFTYDEVFYLGIFEITTGLVSAIFPQLGLILWTLGFGILHIVYGVFMYRKYDL
jgi:hypothetical protein